MYESQDALDHVGEEEMPDIRETDTQPDLELLRIQKMIEELNG